MWIIYAVLVHIALLVSIFVIYFRSPVITGLTPQNDLDNPPAKRLVLFVMDGLRAESFFKENGKHVPNIQKLIEKGVTGISQTRVPTETRPGHIALLAGMFEDPSAVLRQWKVNPIDFDNVFNRSAHTYAWGDSDVLDLFSKITKEDRLMSDAYCADDFISEDKRVSKDEWVFNRTTALLRRKTHELQEEERIIFFLHLLDTDQAGHFQKPGTELFWKSLQTTEKGIYGMYLLFESIFPDQKTAYVIASDHGMTDHGSHGAGEAFETETPFVCWGAGVKNWRELVVGETVQIGKISYPLLRIDQVQTAPLLTTLIGVSPPVNNFGILPMQIFSTTEEYMARAMHNNALQILAQFEMLLHDFEKGFFSSYMPQFSELGVTKIKTFQKDVSYAFKTLEYDRVVSMCSDLMQKALKGIEYYRNYYQVPLLLCTALTFVFWMLYLMVLISDDKLKHKASQFSKGTLFVPMLVGCFILVFIRLQHLPLSIGFYMVLPVMLWVLLIHGSAIKHSRLSPKINKQNIMVTSIVIVGSILIGLSFFNRSFISLAFLLFAALNFKSIRRDGKKFYLWLILTILVLPFPLFPVILGKSNDLFLLMGATLTVGRNYFVKARFDKRIYIVTLLGLLNTAYCVYKVDKDETISFFFLMTSWLFLGYSLVVPFCVPKDALKSQVELIFFTLSTAYIQFCLTYEAAFIVLLSTQLMVTFSQDASLPFDQQNIKKHAGILNTFQYAFAIILYICMGFFGTGNLASVNSYDPNVMRCFLNDFSKDFIMVLVVLKLFLPMLLNVIILYGTIGTSWNERKVFMALLFICDLIGLHFLFLVRNTGSWLEIGTSISHFVIMKVVTLFLVGTSCIAKLYLGNTQILNSIHRNH